MGHEIERVVVVGGDSEAETFSMKMNGCILSGTKGGADRSKDNGEVWGDEVDKEESFKNVGCEPWVAGFVFVAEDESMGLTDSVKCLKAVEVVSVDFV